MYVYFQTSISLVNYPKSVLIKMVVIHNWTYRNIFKSVCIELTKNEVHIDILFVKSYDQYLLGCV